MLAQPTSVTALAKQSRWVQVGPKKNLDDMGPAVYTTAIFHAQGNFGVVRAAYLRINVEAPNITVPCVGLGTTRDELLKAAIILEAPLYDK
jgi:hypothetical protein